MTGFKPEPVLTGLYTVIIEIAWLRGPIIVEVTNRPIGSGG